MNRLLNAAANGNGTPLDLGVGTAWDKINYQLSAPGTVTAHTVTLAGSADNVTYVTITDIANVRSAEGTLRVIGNYRYLRAALASYAGSGNVVLEVEVGKSNPQN